MIDERRAIDARMASERPYDWWCKPEPLERPPRPRPNAPCPPATWSPFAPCPELRHSMPCMEFSIPDHEEMDELNRWYMAHHMVHNVQHWRDPEAARRGEDGAVISTFLYCDLAFHSGVETAYGYAPSAVAVGRPWPLHRTRGCGIALARNGVRHTPQHRTFEWTPALPRDASVVVGTPIGPAPAKTPAEERTVPTGYSRKGGAAGCSTPFDVWLDVDGTPHTRIELFVLVGTMSSRRQFERAFEQGFRY